MTLGERCDEIVRLIDETLSDLSGEGRSTGSLPFEVSPVYEEFPEDELSRARLNEGLCGVGRSAAHASFV